MTCYICASPTCLGECGVLFGNFEQLPVGANFYTHPAQPCQECENLKHDLDSYMKMAHAYANQKPLSDDDIHNLADYNFQFASGMFDEIFAFARAIEKAHGIGEL